MIKINVVVVGKIKEKYIVDGINEYRKRLSKYSNINIIELSEENMNDISISINKESNKIIDYINKNNGYNILLDLRGKTYTSVEMSENIEKITLNNSTINIFIGGSNGVNEDVRKIVDMKLKFSDFTFPHQLMRLILFEQLYRWIAIKENIKYHK